jgi:hypothetical protein
MTQPDNDDFHIPSIGSLRKFQGRPWQELSERLPSDRYALYLATHETPPAGWPRQAMDNKKIRTASLGPAREIIINDWFSLTGTEWAIFYGFVLTTYIEELGLIPGYVYERGIEQNISFVRPLAALMVIIKDDTIKWISRRLVESIIKERQFPSPPDETARACPVIIPLPDDEK